MKKINLVRFVILSFTDLFKARVLGVLFLPFLLSTAAAVVISYIAWPHLIHLGNSLYLTSAIQYFVEIFKPYVAISNDPFTVLVILFFLLGFVLPFTVLTAIFLSSILVVPALIHVIHKTDYPKLLQKNRSPFFGTAKLLSLSAKYFFVWVGTLPIWLLIPGASFLIPFLLMTWFNSRLFAWEILLEFCDPSEVDHFIHHHHFALLGLGALTSFLYFIPVINFLAPVLTAATFVRFCMHQLQAERP